MVEREEISITIEDDIDDKQVSLTITKDDIKQHSFTVLGPHGGIRQKLVDMSIDVDSPVGIIEDRTYPATIRFGSMDHPVEFTDKGNHVLIEGTDL